MKRWLLAFLLWGAASAGWTQDVAFSSTVDKTAVQVGDPITLTITLSGDASGVELPPPEFPEGFVVTGQSHTTNVSFRSGVAERVVSLVYVLVPQQPGTFKVGPFRFTRRGQEVSTEPIEITVTKRPSPPTLKPQGGRFLL